MQSIDEMQAETSAEPVAETVHDEPETAAEAAATEQTSAQPDERPQINTQRRPSPLVIVLEIAVICAAIWFFTDHLQDWSPDYRVRGPEFSYLIGSGAIAHELYARTGTISLWNPFIGVGEPLLESPFSYVLNPLMTLPVLWLGPIQGAKIAVLLHLLLLGVGGWLLAYVLRIGWAGRLLLGLLLAGNGSIAGSIGMGFYQMSLSQTYMPWILAGLFGVINTPKRRYVTLLAGATTLMIFAGTFWYVLPSAINVAAFSLFAVFVVKTAADGNKKFVLDRALLGRLVLTGVFIFGLAAVRLIPQTIHHDRVAHPTENLHNTYDLIDVASLYVTTETLETDVPSTAIYYHYIVPPLFAGFVLLARLLLTRAKVKFPNRWRIVIPALLLIAFYTFWAQEGTFWLRWAYENLPLLEEWRFVGRMMAAATPLIALLIAIWFDDIVRFVQQRLNRGATLPLSSTAKGLSGIPQVNIRLSSRLLLVPVLVAIAAISAAEILSNWRQVAGTEYSWTAEQEPVAFLREREPASFISVQTNNFFTYLPFYENLVRTTFGNPDYSPLGLQSTIGSDVNVRYDPQYAVGIDQSYNDYWQSIGYTLVEDAPRVFEQDTLWYNPNAPTYAYVIERSALDDYYEPITRDRTHPIDGYLHRIDEIDIFASGYPPESVLFVTETAYPGWRVTVNGEPSELESLGRRLAVELPDDGAPVTVSFRYRPFWLYFSAVIGGVTMILFTGYALQLEKLLPDRARTVLLGGLGRTGTRLVSGLLTSRDEDGDLPTRDAVGTATAGAGSGTTIEDGAVTALTQQFILARLASEADAGRLDAFVARLFTALGYRVELGQSTGQLDVLAHPDGVALGPSVIKVLVEPGMGQVAGETVAAFHAGLAHDAYGVVVTLGSFDDETLTFADEQTNLRLIDGVDLTTLIMDNYEHLDTDDRALLPLKRTYVPDNS